ncbi:RING-H2 finger protein ATL58-like [Salvia miltiorrhiza]|uniref:RING-H2 finger protein ATL58-like n=1 Tax=Salvia miltiorrhiza TaxID=226208 RepID=UPI0025AD0EAD|nr:RING-H2 finger protein ATL58-like [Salvia miltiorrhiza]
MSKNRNSEREIGSSSNGSSSCCSNASSQLKIYQTFIFSVPIFFTFILLFLFYWFYLRRRRADWSSLRMRANNSVLIGDDISRCELGLKKELREMLPIIVFNHSFSVKDTLCSVCLGEYLAEDKLQQIPSCGHTFHMDCIDLWLTIHTTCPLCRHSLLAPTLHQQTQTNQDPQTSDPPSETDEGLVAIARDQHDDPEAQTQRGVMETVK